MTEHTARHIELVSFLFFLVCASLYLVSWLLFKNDVLPNMTGAIATYTDLPAVAAGMTLITTKMMRYLHALGDEHRMVRISVLIVAVTLFLGLAVLNIFATA